MKRILSILSLCLILFSVSANNPLDKKVNIKEGKTTIKEALKQIVKQSSIQFVYITNAFDGNKKIILKSQKVSIKKELEILFPNEEVKITTAGNKIILSRNNNKHTHSKSINSAKNPTHIIIKHEIELVKADSIIYKHDTIKTEKKDTIIIFKKKNNKTLNRESKIFKGIFSFGIKTEGNLPIEEYTNNNSSNTNFQLLKSGENPKIGGSVCLLVRYNLPNININFGLGWSINRWNADYDFTTISTNYNNITGWKETSILIPDSTKIEENPKHKDSILQITRTPIYEKDTINTNYHSTNTAHYLSIPLGINYHHRIFDTKLEWEAGVAFQLKLLITSTGNSMYNDEEKIIKLNNLLTDFYLKGGLCTGINYNIDKNNEIGINIGLSTNLTPIFNNNSASSRRELTPSIGLSYFFSPF